MNADLMVHEIDDERTIEEEEMLESGEEFSNEVNNLQKVSYWYQISLRTLVSNFPRNSRNYILGTVSLSLCLWIKALVFWTNSLTTIKRINHKCQFYKGWEQQIFQDVCHLSVQILLIAQLSYDRLVLDIVPYSLPSKLCQVHNPVCQVIKAVTLK